MFTRALKVLDRLRKAQSKAFSSKHLLYTNVGISMSLSAVGDVIEQQYQIMFGELKELDKWRTGRMAGSGVTVGFACHYWYKFIDKKLPGRTIRLVMKKVLLDQIIGSPINISVLFITLGLLERKTVHEIAVDMKDKFIRLYTAEWIIWPPAQIVNFYWLPTQYRVLYDNTISLGYDIYTSRVTNDS